MIKQRSKILIILCCCKRSKNYNATVSRQNIQIHFLLFLLFDVIFFFQAEDGIRDRSPSRGLGDVYKRQAQYNSCCFFCCKKKQKLQCSGLTSKYSNSFIIVSIVWRQLFFSFVLFFRNNSWCFYIFSELSGLKTNVLFMEIYIPMKSSILSLTKYAIFM